MAETVLKISAQDAASSAIKGVQSSVDGLSNALGAVGLTLAMKGMAEEAAKDEVRFLALQNNIKNFGAVTGVTTDTIKAVNEQFKNLGLFSEDAVTQAEMIVSKFDVIGKETFPQVLDLAGQVAAKMGIDLPDASERLGRSLEMPQTAFRQLNSLGIAMSPTIRQNINDMVKLGDTAGADALVLKTVSQGVAGFTDELKGTGAGALMAFNASLENMKEQINAVFLEAVKPALNIVTDMINWFLSLDEGTKKLIITFGLTVVAITAVGAAIKVLSAIMVTNPFILLATTIVAAAVALAGFMDDTHNVAADISKMGIKEAESQFNQLADKLKATGLAYKDLDSAIKSGKLKITENNLGDIATLQLLRDRLQDLAKVDLQERRKKWQQETDQIIKIEQDFQKKINALDNNEQANRIMEEAADLKRVGNSEEAKNKIREYYRKLDQKSAQDNALTIVAAGSNMAGQLGGVMASYYANQIAAAQANGQDTKQLQKDAFVTDKAVKTAQATLAIPKMVMDAYNSLVGIPVVGPALAVAAGIAAGAFGAIQAGLIAAAPMPTFAEGGVVGGSSYSGDNITARVNSGEMILTVAQQKALLAGKSGTTINHYGNVIASDPLEYNRKIQIQTRRLEAARGVVR